MYNNKLIKFYFMKKLILFTFAMLLCMPAFSKQKIRIEKVEPDSTKEEVVAYRTRATHLSLSGHFGIGMLDGDQSQPFSAIFPRSAKHLNFGINLEYSFNPIWGLYLEYLYNPYGGKSTYANQIMGEHTGDRYDFRGMNHEIGLGASLSLLNLFSKCRPQVFNWYLNAGLGVSIFKITEHPMLGTDPLGILPTWEKDSKNKGRSLSFPIGTTFEVNATRWLAIMLNLQYRVHFQDTYDGSIRGNDDDNTAYAGIGLRWKINSLSHRNRNHVRDMAMCTWEETASEKLSQENSRRIDTLEGRVDYLDVRFKALEPRVRDLEEKLRDTDEDGVPDIFDREPNTPPNTPVNSNGQAIFGPESYGTGKGVYQEGDYVPGFGPVPVQQRSNSRTVSSDAGGTGSGTDRGKYGSDYGKGSVYSSSVYQPENAIIAEDGLSVYFATGRFDISAASHNVLSAIARKMQAHPDYLLEIHAYCDEQGVRSNYANQKLSDNRAKKVRDTLVSKYGIDASRIVEYIGHGVLEGAPTIDYLPNRRADIFLVR